MTSCTKAEVHNIVFCRQRRSEPRSQVTYAENSVKFGYVVFEKCVWTGDGVKTFFRDGDVCQYTGVKTRDERRHLGLD